jgi:hypothetical protein
MGKKSKPGDGSDTRGVKGGNLDVDLPTKGLGSLPQLWTAVMDSLRELRQHL